MSAGRNTPKVYSARPAEPSRRFLLIFATFIFTISLVNGLRITNMTSPMVADLRDKLTLDCKFDMGAEQLYAVKWYKDEQEFFRYMPTGSPTIMSFPVAGVHLLISSSNCTHDQCRVELDRLNRDHSGGAYRCEVSSEAPAFRLASQTNNITVAALPKGEPRIEGLAPDYLEGETVHADCVSELADPAPILSWYINGYQLIPLNKDSNNPGYLYESQLSAALAIQLANDPNVQDFWLIANPSEIKSFDDIIIKVDYKKPTPDTAIFLIQSKHTQKQIKLDMNPDQTKRRSTGPKFMAINLYEYKKNFEQICELANGKLSYLTKIFSSVPIANYYFCVFTTASVVEPSLDDIDALPNLKLLNIADGSIIKQFINDVPEEYQNFAKKLFFYTDQPNTSEITRYIETHLKGFSSSMTKSLCSDISDHLKANDSCNPITKSMFTSICTAIILRQNLSQYMIHTSPIRRNCIPLWRDLNSNYQFIKISKEKGKDLLPLIASYYEQRIRELSEKFPDSETQTVFQEFDWNACVRNCFQLDFIPKAFQRLGGTRVANLIDLLLYMWHKEGLALVTDEAIAEMSEKLSETKKRFIIISTKRLAPSDNVLETAHDLKQHGDIFKSVMDFEFSLQGRPPVPLGVIINKENDAVLRSITAYDILRWTGETQRQIGSPINNTIPNYIPRKFYHSNNHITEDAVFTIAENHDLTIISNDAGMGKSTVLQSLALKSNHQYFVVLYDLANCRQELATTHSNVHSDPVMFLYDKMEKQRNSYIDAIFGQHLSDGNVMIFIDSFDEILPLHREDVLAIVQKIVEKKVRVFITSRTQAEDVVTKRFQCAVLKLIHLTLEEATEYCRQAGVPKTILASVPGSILTVPLHLVMLQRIRDDNIHNITKLYNHFFDEMMRIYYKKIRIQEDHVHNRLIPHQELIGMSHRYVALVYLFGEEKITDLNIISRSHWKKILEDFEEYRLELGIILQIEPILFRHKTFAEYLVAKYIATTMHHYATQLLYKEIVTDIDNKQTYVFLNEMRSEEFGDDSIQMAILKGDVKRVTEVYAADQKCLDKKDRTWGMYPIHWAAVKYFLHQDSGSVKVLEAILKHQTTMDVEDDFLKWHWTSFLVGKVLPKLPQVPVSILLDILPLGLLKRIETSGTELYHEIFEEKLRKYLPQVQTVSNKDYVFMFHYKAALIYLFGKEEMTRMKIITDIEEREFNKLNIGVISKINPIKFKHDAYAQYLVARYIAQTISITNESTKLLYEKVVTQPSYIQVYKFLNEIRSENYGPNSIEMAILKGDLKKLSEICIPAVFNDSCLDRKDIIWGMHPVHWAAVNCFLLRDETSVRTLHKILQYSKTYSNIQNLSTLDDDFLGWNWVNFLCAGSHGIGQATVAYEFSSLENLSSHWIHKMITVIHK